MYDYVSRTVFIVAIMAVLLLAGGGIAFTYLQTESRISEIEETARTTIEAGLSGFGTRLTPLEERVTANEGNISSLQSNFARADTDIAKLMEDLKEMAEDLRGFKQDLEGFEQELEDVKEDVEDLEGGATTPAESIEMSVTMSPAKTIQAAGNYYFYVTLTNNTNYIQHIHIKGLFMGTSHSSTVDSLNTKLKVAGNEASKQFIPAAANCAYMEFSTLGSAAVIIPAESTKTVTVIFTLAYTSGLDIWDYSFSRHY